LIGAGEAEEKKQMGACVFPSSSPATDGIVNPTYKMGSSRIGVGGNRAVSFKKKGRLDVRKALQHDRKNKEIPKSQKNRLEGGSKPNKESEGGKRRIKGNTFIPEEVPEGREGAQRVAPQRKKSGQQLRM